jgi:hypothetical protein
MCRVAIPVLEGKTMFRYNDKDDVKPIERTDNLNVMLVEDKKKHKRVDRNAKNIPAPAWVDCYFKRGDNVCGQILCSFIIVKNIDHPWEKEMVKDFSIVQHCVPFQEMLVSINVLGLRNLKPPGIMPIKKAIVEFGMQSLVTPATSRAIENKKTRPGNSGPNPTINSVIEFTIDMPVLAKYAPTMPCYVYD